MTTTTSAPPRDCGNGSVDQSLDEQVRVTGCFHDAFLRGDIGTTARVDDAGDVGMNRKLWTVVGKNLLRVDSTFAAGNSAVSLCTEMVPGVKEGSWFPRQCRAG